MTLDDAWLAAVWPFVHSQLPPAPATVLEVGCGPLGGFVPALLDAGYHAVGVDPKAPQGPGYRPAPSRSDRPTGAACWPPSARGCCAALSSSPEQHEGGST